ncbi:class I SAM-dependent methyltransferase [Gramella sp. AN32]|uniref:Class I SAM-dependent methyltransferase n=1 Tax=Christiangramia antarctica TaxID=2058158 RepID=A0ABW5XA18_9FLAO|nr:class I SAM-dependent methyltransferase [Gramella sp. AN32]MCM4154712.1 class I SAM-dependent methyltransferase [Gramella sp. AN32]
MHEVADHNQDRNKEHYEKLYANYNIANTLYWLKNLDRFLEKATTTETSWYALYQFEFKERIKDKSILEMGCGDCVNAAIMAGLGAKVSANDLASASGEIIRNLNKNHGFKYPIKFIEGDFLNNGLEERSFDFIVGKAFLHHLEIPLEKKFLKETSRLLKSTGEARFFEPAVNSRILDEIRWYIPVKGRPSKFNRKAFKNWKTEDPHPDRSYSSIHFENAGKQFFKNVKIVPIGTLERFSRLLKWGEKRNNFKKWALKNEQILPQLINKKFTRSQLIIYREPK